MSTGSGPGLFRPEALDAQRRAALGRIQINTPPAFWVVTLLTVAFIAAAAAYLYCGHYTRRATVSGMLVPAAGLITLNATAGGQVLRVQVRQGERVRAGQVLAEFDNPEDSAALGNTLALITSELNGERKGLQKDLTTQRSLSASQAVSLRGNIQSLHAQLTQLQGQLAIQQEEATQMGSLLARIAPLAKEGYVSVYELQQQQAATFNAEVQVKALRRDRLSLGQQLVAAEQQLRQVPLTLASQQSEIQNKLSQVEQGLAQNEIQRAWVLKAPKSGIVATLLIKSGQAVTVGEPLLTVLPAGSTLEAQLLVPTSAIGFVHDRQRVVLRYQAFPYQKFGLHYGEVSQVSRSALAPKEVASLVGEQTTAPLYRVLVRLNDQQVNAYGHGVALRPGMVLDASILLDRRRLIEWVLEPLYGLERRMAADGNTGSAGA